MKKKIDWLKSNLIFVIIAMCAPAWYWLIVVQIATYYYDEATHHFKMGAMFYDCNNSESGEREGITGKKYLSKANNTLLWLPKFARP